MNEVLFTKKRLIVAMVAIGFSGVSQAALTISNSPASSGTGRIAWGGNDSLSQARAIMYGDSDSSHSINYSNNQSNYSTYNNSNNSHKKYQNNYSTESSKETAKSFKNYTHNYDESKSSTSYGSQYNNGYNNYNTYNSYNAYKNYGNYGNSYDTSAYEKLAISTGSRGVMVVDLVTGEPIYEKNANTARPIASITKIMTAMVVLDAGLDMSEEIKIDPVDFVGPKKASSRLKAGDRMNRAELLLMMLMKSENPAAKTLARHYPGGYSAFMNAMNSKARSIGMHSAFFGDPTGLDKRNVASPADLVKMIKAAGNYDVIRRFSTTSNYDFYVANYSRGSRTYKARNTNYLVRNGSYPIGISKTGFINEAGKCVVMETQINNRPAVVVLLGARNSATRWKDAETILSSLSNRRVI